MSTSFSGTITNGTVTFTQDIPPGIVTQASLSSDEESLGPAGVHGTLYIVPKGVDIFTPDYILIADYFSIDKPLIWNGFLSLDSNSEIVARVTGDRTGNWFLNYRRITQNNIREIGEFLRSVIHV